MVGPRGTLCNMVWLLTLFELSLDQNAGTREGKTPVMRFEKLHHVQLAMPPGEEEKARDFYARLLGLPEVPKPAELAKRGGVWFESEDIRVHLGVETDFRPAKKAHPAFQVSGLSELARQCRGAGFRVVEDGLLEGYDRIYVDDPFGNRLEFLEPGKGPA